jgi:hypothetical protein
VRRRGARRDSWTIRARGRTFNALGLAGVVFVFVAGDAWRERVGRVSAGSTRERDERGTRKTAASLDVCFRMRRTTRDTTDVRFRARTFFLATAAALLDVGPIVAFAARSRCSSSVPAVESTTVRLSSHREPGPVRPGWARSEKRTPSPGKVFVTPRSVRCQCLRALLAPSPLGLCACRPLRRRRLCGSSGGHCGEKRPGKKQARRDRGLDAILEFRTSKQSEDVANSGISRMIKSARKIFKRIVTVLLFLFPLEVSTFRSTAFSLERSERKVSKETSIGQIFSSLSDFSPQIHSTDDCPFHERRKRLRNSRVGAFWISLNGRMMGGRTRRRSRRCDNVKFFLL